MIDKQKDEFIVDCTNNSEEERQEVYKFLVENRNYNIGYLTNNYSVIVCNKVQGDSNYLKLDRAKKYFPNYPVYTFQQFKEMYLDEFVLPEKWCINRQNKSEVINWFNKNGCLNRDYNERLIGWYSHFPNYEAQCYTASVIQPSYTEITFEQFKKYVLKNTMQENNKKIVGYKLIKPEYMEAIEKIANKNIIGENNGVRTYFNNNILSYRAQISINNLKEAGVLDIWFEPLYEEEVKTINMGSFNLTIKDKKIFHKSEDITSFVIDMQYIFTPILNNKFGKNNDYQCLVEDVVFKKTGCEFNTTKLSDWLKVYDMIK